MRLYLYCMLCVMRDKTTLFWTLCFPFLLGTFFFLGFGNLIGQTDNFEAIPVAVVEKADNEAFDTVLDNLTKGDDPILKVQKTDEAKALALLKDSKVDGVIEVGNTLTLTCREEGVAESTLKGIIDRYLQAEATLTTIAGKNPAALEQAADALLDDSVEIRDRSLSGGSLDYMLQYFYALVGMTCLYGGFFGINNVANIQSAQTPLGARRNITPTPKLQMLGADFLATLTVVIVELCLLLLYLRFAFGVLLGDSVPAVLLLCLVGGASGIMTGMVIGIAIKLPQNAKEGIFIGVAMLFSFLGGLMYTDMRHIVEANVPFLNRINPASIVVDSFYALETYGVGERYWMNILNLLVLVLILGTVSLVALRGRPRRTTYHPATAAK